ncbi:MAG: hypothetical protein HY360_17470, partial [Verrucomicrobia bacterium]|nr:hypothetical protein [Verrucomicrobiota bacterium]
MSIQFDSLIAARDWLQDLLRRDGPFFDADGVLRGAINVRTLQPFTAEWARTQTQPRQGGAPEPLAIDYVAAHTYEDSWDAMGNYLEYLVARHNVTREEELVHEMRRIVKMATDVYREDNPDDNEPAYLAKRGFFRRLYAGRHGQWPYPEILGTDQMAPLQFGLLQARDFLDSTAQRELDTVLVGALGWYLTRNFAYLYRGTAIHNIEGGPHALSYYLPALVWAHRVTGNPKYLKAFHRMHEDYL